jgi:hypothetical protein
MPRRDPNKTSPAEHPGIACDDGFDLERRPWLACPATGPVDH